MTADIYFMCVTRNRVGLHEYTKLILVTMAANVVLIGRCHYTGERVLVLDSETLGSDLSFSTYHFHSKDAG